MEKLVGHEPLIFLTQILILFVLAKGLGELSKKLKQPAVVGEILAGILIGPTILGNFFPSIFNHLFVEAGGAAIALDGFMLFSVIMLLFVVGLEVDIQSIIRQRKQAGLISILGLILPAILGVVCGYFIYDMTTLPISQTMFALFIGSAMSISALPVIAKVLIDLELIKTDTGALILAIATINDIVGWLFFTVVLGMSGVGGETNVWAAIILTLLFAVLSVTKLRMWLEKLLELGFNVFKNRSAIVGIVLILIFLASIFTEKIGVHAVFGSFLIGVALSGSKIFDHELKESICFFTLSFLAPVFFASVGLKVNFFQSFNLTIVLLLIITAYVGKIAAAMIGGKLSHMTKDESIAVGLGIAARGGIGIILAIVAYNSKLINDTLFTALVVMSVVTSMTAGLIKRFVAKKDSIDISVKNGNIVT